MTVEASDELDFITWGGSGWGDPLERDSELVAKEFRQRLVPLAGARLYGMAIANGMVDVAATDTLVITGFSTSGCVRATVLDALQHGFVPYVVREACGDRAPEPHEANLFDLQAKYAEVVGLAEVLPLLQQASR